MKSFFSTITLVVAVLVTGCASNIQSKEALLFDNQHVNRMGNVVTKSYKPGCSLSEHSNAIEMCISKPSEEEQLKSSARAARQLQGVTAPNNAFFIEQDIRNAKLAAEMKEAEKRFFANR